MKNIFKLLKKGFGSAKEPVTNGGPAPSTPGDVRSFMPSTPVLRDAIIGFIIQSLQPYVDEKALSISRLHFYIVCSDREEEEAARVALYMHKAGMFKSEQLERKLVNHFIQLEPDWLFECHIVKEQQLPENCIRKLNFALNVVRSGENVAGHYSKALVQILIGQAEYS